MTDKQLEYIVAIASEGNVTHAAAKLFVGQSSLSQTLSHVENEIGAKIFYRRQGALVPTPAGEHFLKAARDILEIKKNLLAKYREDEDPCSGTICVGMSQSRSWIFTPLILPSFLSLYPKANIVFTEGNEEELNRLLANGKIDLIFTAAPYSNSAFSYYPLIDERTVLAVSSKYGLGVVQKKAVLDHNLNAFRNIPFIMMHKNNSLRRLADQILSDGELCPNVLLESHSMDVCFQMVANGLGATIVPETLYIYHKSIDSLDIFPTGAQYNRRVAIGYRKDAYLPFITREFIRVTSKVLEDEYLSVISSSDR